MIKPTIGRIVWFYGSKDLLRHQPLPAIVCFVESDVKVNLEVFGAKGGSFPREGVTLVQDIEKSKAEEALPVGEFCTWMPFQKAQPQVAMNVEERLATLESRANRPLQLTPEEVAKQLEVAVDQRTAEVLKELETRTAHLLAQNGELHERIRKLEAAFEGVPFHKAVELGPDGRPKLWVPPGNPGNPLPAGVTPGAPPVVDVPSKPPVPKQVI